MHCQEVNSNISMDSTEQLTRGVKADHKGFCNQPPPIASSVPHSFIHFSTAAITKCRIYSVLPNTFSIFLSSKQNIFHLFVFSDSPEDQSNVPITSKEEIPFLLIASNSTNTVVLKKRTKHWWFTKTA